jgi:hypothetical protein
LKKNWANVLFTVFKLSCPLVSGKSGVLLCITEYPVMN